MAKFVFRLQSFLGVKEQIEDLKKNEYGIALRRLEEERRRKEMLEQELVQNVLFLKESVNSIIEPMEIRRYNNRIDILKTWIIKQEEKIKAAEEYAEEKRLELVEAMKERKAIEIVKENAYEEFVKQEDRVTRRTTDELISYKYATR